MGIHKYTNTNTQRHKDTYTAYDKVPERPNMCYIFEKRLVQGYQKLHSRVPNSQIQKYKYTNTQIQHMTNCQKDPKIKSPPKSKVPQNQKSPKMKSPPKP